MRVFISSDDNNTLFVMIKIAMCAKLNVALSVAKLQKQMLFTVSVHKISWRN